MVKSLLFGITKFEFANETQLGCVKS